MANKPNRIILLLDRKEYISSEPKKRYNRELKQREFEFDTSDSIQDSHIFTKKQASNTEHNLNKIGIDCIIIPTNIVRDIITISYNVVRKRQVGLKEYSELKLNGLIFDSMFDANKALIKILEKNKDDLKRDYELSVKKIDRDIEYIYDDNPELKREQIINRVLGDG